MFPTKSALAQCLVSATLLCAAQVAWAGVPNATCSFGIAKTAACQGGNNTGQPASKDASCCEVKPGVSARTGPDGLGRTAPRGFYSMKTASPPPSN